MTGVTSNAETELLLFLRLETRARVDLFVDSMFGHAVIGVISNGLIEFLLFLELKTRLELFVEFKELLANPLAADEVIGVIPDEPTVSSILLLTETLNDLFGVEFKEMFFDSFDASE